MPDCFPRHYLPSPKSSDERPVVHRAARQRSERRQSTSTTSLQRVSHGSSACIAYTADCIGLSQTGRRTRRDIYERRYYPAQQRLHASTSLASSSSSSSSSSIFRTGRTFSHGSPTHVSADIKRTPTAAVG